MALSYVKPRKARERLRVRISAHEALGSKMDSKQFKGYNKPGSLRK
jgi:hypothetical protein